jgi:chromosome segregation protein
MKFSKLRIAGFKSFVEPMEFIIGDGLTGVVGPNGCGKSNLVEALRWVMGENSYKNMRASGMDDVIFSGSLATARRATPPKSALPRQPTAPRPNAFNDADMLEVSRRIERESGSNYRINSARMSAPRTSSCCLPMPPPARARPRWSGRADRRADPRSRQARRQILEEAAGISGLHSRRHEAEIRLRGRRTEP